MAATKTQTVQPGISIRSGPVDEMDVDPPHTNGQTNGKRKARASNGQSYKEHSSSDDDDQPLVCCGWHIIIRNMLTKH